MKFNKEKIVYENGIRRYQSGYTDYFAYQSETREKLFKMYEVFEKNGFEYIFVEDLVKD